MRNELDLWQFLSDYISPKKEAAQSNSMGDNLTQREREVYDLVVKGKSDKEIAAQLGMTARTARFHVSNILAKTNTSNRLQLVWAAANIVRQSMMRTVHPQSSIGK